MAKFERPRILFFTCLLMHNLCYFVKILLSTKSTYSAKITALKPLKVLMSAVPLEVIDNGDTHTFLFQQTVPVQSYLIALAIGILASKTLSPVSKLWFEPEEIDKNIYEFEQKNASISLLVRKIFNHICHIISWEDGAILKIDWDLWLYTCGMPPIIPLYYLIILKILSKLLRCMYLFVKPRGTMG
ncbi:leukotriene A-4 hydrolase-like isoform X3 [Aphis gossypii]|uniref:leukotriene A-4 hydrolase-like isoform X3 n=1 Tax=Aphis gossypii TaxID=80765 RepID=UPI002158D277|nr:leukotriene A-4 hydrolase-like isoform X3 [Aphis gossypii]